MANKRQRKPCVFCNNPTYLVKRGTGESICSPCMEQRRTSEWSGDNWAAELSDLEDGDY